MSERLKLIRKLSEDPSKDVNILVGNNTNIHPSACIGKGGFGWELNEQGKYEYFPHFGDVIIGDNCDIGAFVCVDRGNLSNTVIEDGVKIDNLTHIAHNVKIGSNVIVCANVTICGSVTIGNNSYIAPNTCVREHVKIGNNVMIGMGSVVTKDIPDNEIWFGNPAKKHGTR